jgi:hypothetical protein
MAKLLLTALAAALVVAVSPARAFDGNDRVLSVDKYQQLPANQTFEVAEYRPYGSQVGAFEELGQAIDSLFQPETYVQEPTYAYAGSYYRPLDGTPRHSSYYTRRRSYGYSAPSYRPRDIACKASVSASTALSRPGIGVAKWSTTNVWERTVSSIHGAAYASFSQARNKRWDCTGGVVAKCTVTASPCRSY